MLQMKHRRNHWRYTQNNSERIHHMEISSVCNKRRRCIILWRLALTWKAELAQRCGSSSELEARVDWCYAKHEILVGHVTEACVFDHLFKLLLQQRTHTRQLTTSFSQQGRHWLLIYSAVSNYYASHWRLHLQCYVLSRTLLLIYPDPDSGHSPPNYN